MHYSTFDTASLAVTTVAVVSASLTTAFRFLFRTVAETLQLRQSRRRHLRWKEAVLAAWRR